MRDVSRLSIQDQNKRKLAFRRGEILLPPNKESLIKLQQPREDQDNKMYCLEAQNYPYTYSRTVYVFSFKVKIKFQKLHIKFKNCVRFKTWESYTQLWMFRGTN